MNDIDGYFFFGVCSLLLGATVFHPGAGIVLFGLLLLLKSYSNDQEKSKD